MNFSAWFSQITHRKPVDPGSDCSSIQPLLSLYSDKMTAPAESARVEAHLLECEECRRALSWMQATNAVLAHREPVLPPPDMSLRIRSAIAELETGKKAKPARAPLAYRPAFAAAFTILIGAMVVAQITLYHGKHPRILPSGGDAVAVQPPPVETTPSIAPSTSVKPNVAPVRPIRRNPSVTVAKRLPLEPADNNAAESVSATEKKARANVMDILSGKHIASLPEVSIHTAAHSKAPKAFVIKPNTGAQMAALPHPSTHAAPIVTPKHPSDTVVATRETPTHETTSPATDVIPTPPTPEAPTNPDPVRVASTDSHPIDALSGVRSKVDYMRTVSFVLPSSARSVQVGGRAPINAANAARTVDYLHSESDTAPIVRQ